jgi:hypothetical protein
MIETNRRRHAPLDTLVSVECGVHLGDVLIQSGAPEMLDMPEIPGMPDMPTIPAMRDTRADARHCLLTCAIVAPQRRGGFGAGLP